MKFEHIASILALMSAILNVVLGIYIYKKAVKNTANRFFVILTFITALWALVNAIYLRYTLFPFINFAYSVGLIVLFFILIWISTFTQRRFSKPIILLLVASTIIISTLTLVRNFFIKDDVRYLNFGFEIFPGPFFHIYSLYIIFLTIFAYWIFYSQWRKTVGLQRVQYNYIFLGIVFPTSIIIFFDFILPFFKIYNLATFDSLLSLIFVGTIGYSITRYRFLDIKVVIRKGFAHFVSLAIVLFLYIYLLIFSQKYFIKQFGWNEQTTTIFLVLIIVLTIEPLRRFLYKIVDKAFFSKAKDEQVEAAKLQVTLNSSMQFDQLIKKVTDELKGYLMVEEIQFIWLNRQSGNLENYYENESHMTCGPADIFTQYLKGHEEILVTEELPYLIEEQGNGEREVLRKVEKKLKGWGTSLVLPIGERGELVGAFLFGKRKNREAYTSDSVSYLHSLQVPITNAVANALLYKQAVERIATMH